MDDARADMRSDIDSLLQTIAALVEAGGKLAMRYHGRLTSVRQKADSSPLTEADLAVDALLCDGLARAFPGTPVVTEERADSHRDSGRRFFLVDPIDGTREFVAERGEFTVNIGLIEDGRPVAGAVGAPAVGRLFYGAAGFGAFEKAANGEGARPIRPAVPDNERLTVIASRSHLDPATEAFIACNKVGRKISAGSSLKFCRLAAGEADLYPRFGPTMEWDTAAGHAILAAAGGFVEQISGKPLNYGKPDYRNAEFIAYTPGTKFQIGPA